MDKQKQIEEMAKGMCEHCIENEEFTCSIVPQPCVFAKTFAETLYNAGYRKIPENAVVLTRKEYERLLKIEKDFNTVHYCFVEKSRVEETRKETAEKFVNGIEDILKQPFEGKTEKQEWQRKGMEEGLRMALEICKEIIGEEK